MAKPLKLVFLGSDPIALPLLEWLAGEGSAVAQVAAVCTQPDRPAGRGQHCAAGPIKRWAEGRGLAIRQPEKLGSEDRNWLVGLAPDAALVVAYGQILRDDFLAVPRLGTLNLHASILPRHRGASPIQTAVACGERETGMALMRLVRQLDAGPVADLERVPIGPLETAADVEARLAAAAVRLAARALPRLARGELEFREQDHAAATYCRRLNRADSALDFSAPAAVLAARINGLYPWPGCVTELAGLPIRLGLADVIEDPDRAAAPPGEILGTDSEGLRVATGAAVLRLRRLQRPGGRLLAAAEFLRGFPVPAGTRLGSRPMTILSGARPFR